MPADVRHMSPVHLFGTFNPRSDVGGGFWTVDAADPVGVAGGVVRAVICVAST